MKTTIDVPDDLLIRARKRAAETGTPLDLIIARGLRRELAHESRRKPTPGTRKAIRWIAAPGGLPPGLNVANRESLHAWKGSRRSPA